MSSAEQYASWVLDPSNAHRTGRLIKLAAQRFLNDLKRTDIYFDEVEASHCINFIERYCLQWEGDWEGKPFKLEPWQKFALQNIYGWIRKDTGRRRFNKAYIQISKKNGKALDINTPIPTPNGWRRMIDIKPGDFVFGDDGKPTRVLAVSELMEKESYELTFRGGDKIIACEEHLWRARNNQWKSQKGGFHYYYRTVDTKFIADNYLDKKGFPVIHIQNCKPIEYTHKNLLIQPYTLGCWLGDGHSSGSKVTFNALDPELVSNIELDGYTVVQRAGNKSRNATTYKLGGYNELVSSLRAYNLINNKHIPEVYLQSSVAQRFELLKGLMDTDGTATPRGQCTYCTIRKDFANDVMELVTSLGFKATLTTKIARCQTGATALAYYIGFFPDVPVFKLPRKLKRQKVKVNHRSHHRTIIDIKPVGKRIVKCIQVDNDSHLYLAGHHFIPTHNSSFCGGIALFHLYHDKRVNTPKVFTAANNEDQAKICVNIAGRIIQQSPALAEWVDDGLVKIFNYKDNITEVVHTERNGFIKALSKESGDKSGKTTGGKHGINASLGIVDEFGMSQDYGASKPIETSMASRSERLMLFITTAGFNLEIPCYVELRGTGIKVLEGSEVLDNYFVMLFEIDPPADEEGKEKKITVDWLLDNEHVWQQSNPNIDVSVFRDFLRDQLRDAKQYGGTTEVENLTLNFNVWMNSPSVYIPADVWNQNTHGFKEEELLGSDCYGGIEIGETSVLALLFPGDIVKIKMLFMTAEEVLKFNDFYRENQKEFKVDPGNVLDNDVAIGWLIDEIQKYNMHSFCFAKPQEKNDIVQGLIKQGHQGNPISQGISSISESTNEWERMLRAGQIEHFGNPILRWQNSNCMATRKEIGTRLEKNPKVLGVWACLNAIAQWKTIDAEGIGNIGIVYI